MRMRMQALGATTLALLLLGAAAARADNLDAFNAAVEAFAAHNRAAIGHLRDHDPDRAVAELKQMQDAWGEFAQHFSGTRPDAFRDNKLYVTMLVDVPTRIVTAQIMINFGRPQIAQNSLLAIRQEISDVRRAGGVEGLADAVLDAGASLTALLAALPADGEKPEAAGALTAKADAYGAAIRHCDTLAPAAV